MKTIFLVTAFATLFITHTLFSQELWTPTNITNAPSARYNHTAVWTETSMIIWGGLTTNTGGIYNPVTDTWISTSTVNTPAPRTAHTAVWTGTAMIIWGGGNSSGQYMNTGGIYDPVTDSWTATSTSANCPSARYGNTALWTGSKLLIWGGTSLTGFQNTGGIYDPVTNTWTSISTFNAPAPRSGHVAVWTGSKMIVWGGNDTATVTSNLSNTGGVYDPVTNTWTPTSLVKVPLGRNQFTAVWTGAEMIIWGGLTFNLGDVKSGGRYNPITDTWDSTTILNAPVARQLHSAIWTGGRMIIWGGQGAVSFKTGGIYNPITNSWVNLDTLNSPLPRFRHTAVWAGDKMIIWGGIGTNFGTHNTGGIYSNSGLTSINNTGNNLPVNFSLYQNYPNPFNPSTNIEFQIPSEGFVKLTVFNLLGEEVETTVNKQMQAGIYRIDFDGSRLSSGIYFYTLQTGEYSQTKKMIIIK